MIPVVKTYIYPVFMLECLLRQNTSTKFKPPILYIYIYFVVFSYYFHLGQISTFFIGIYQVSNGVYTYKMFS